LPGAHGKKSHRGRKCLEREDLQACSRIPTVASREIKHKTGTRVVGLDRSLANFSQQQPVEGTKKRLDEKVRDPYRQLDRAPVKATTMSLVRQRHGVGCGAVLRYCGNIGGVLWRPFGVPLALVGVVEWLVVIGDRGTR